MDKKKLRHNVGLGVASAIQILAAPIDLPIAIVTGVKSGIEEFNERKDSGVLEVNQTRLTEIQHKNISWLPSIKLGKKIAGE